MLAVLVWISLATTQTYSGETSNSPPRGGNSPKSTKTAMTLTKEEARLLAAARAKLDDGTFGEVDLGACERQARNLPKEKALHFHLVISEYRRRFEERPEKGIAQLAETVFGKRTASQWKSEQAKDRQGKLAEMPPAEQWVIDEATVPAALEVVQCLMAREEFELGMDVITRIGTTYENMGRVLAAECGGDLSAKMEYLERAITFYEDALRYLRDISQPVVTGSASDLPAAIDPKAAVPVARRLEQKIAGTKDRLDVERYGADFFLYRFAERKRRTVKDPLGAYLAYQEIMETYPDGVYAEASRAYAVLALLDIAELKPETRQKALREAENGLKAAQALERAARAARSSKVSMAWIKQNAENAKAKLTRLKAVPPENRIFQEAELRINGLLEEKEYGLYRGELLLAMGCHLLEWKLDTKAAERWLTRADAWCQTVAGQEEAFGAFEIPTRALAVAAPPPTTFSRDSWGNFNYVDPEPGAVVNRRTAGWYLPGIQGDANRLLGFIAFMDKDNERALEFLRKMSGQDTRVKYLLENDMPNAYRRLSYSIRKEGVFRDAEPKEIGVFKNPRRRLAVFLADYLAEGEYAGRAAKIYRRLLADDFGPASAGEKAYATFGLAWCQWFDAVMYDRPSQKFEAIQTLSPFKNDPRLYMSPIGPRGMSMYATWMSNRLNGDGDLVEAVKQYRQVYRLHPKTWYAELALYRIGVLGPQLGDERSIKEARSSLKRMLKQYKGSDLAKMAKRKLLEINEGRK